MSKKWLVFLSIFAVSTFAQAIMIPESSGGERTVLAIFDTWQADQYDPDIMLPDDFMATPISELDDTYGLADAMLGETGNYLTSYDNHEDVLELNDAQDLDFFVANFEGGEFKEVWIEVTYYSELPDVRPVADVYDAGSDLYMMHAPTYWDREIDTDGWITDAFSFIITPNPSWELFFLNFETESSWDGYPVYVDSVIIETICVPEPTSILMLSSGLTALVIRKRK